MAGSLAPKLPGGNINISGSGDQYDPYSSIKAANYTPALSLLPAGLSPDAAQKMVFYYDKGVWATAPSGSGTAPTLGPGPQAKLPGGSSTGASNTYGGPKTGAPGAAGGSGGQGGAGGDAGLGGGKPPAAPNSKQKDQFGNSISIGGSTFNGGSSDFTGGNFDGSTQFGDINSPAPAGTGNAPASLQGLDKAIQPGAPDALPLVGPGGTRQIGGRIPPPLTGLLKALVY